jgi:hypothetical protein
MSHGKITAGNLPNTGDLTVTGPFRPDDAAVNFANIIFVVVQGMPGASAKDTVVVRGEGAWNRPVGGGTADWSGTAPRNGDPALGPSTNDLQVGPARGIALSVAVQPGSVLPNGDFDPPSIETLTWCANFDIA